MTGILGAAKDALAQAGSDVNVTSVFLASPLVEYQEVTATNGMSAVPRFGHTRNFAALFLETSEEATEERIDYIEGLLFVGSFVLAFFVLWSVLLLAVKFCCCNCYRGILAGRPFTLDDEDEPTIDQFNKWKTRANRTRYVFIASGLILILFAVLMTTMGFNQLNETRIIADNSLDSARSLIDDAAVLTEDLRDVGLSAIDLRDTLVVELEEDRLCPNDPNLLGQDTITKAIEDNADLAIDMLETLGEFATTDIKQMEDGLKRADRIIDELDLFIVQEVEERSWVGTAFVVPLCILTAVLMAGAVLAQQDGQHECFEFTLTWILLPIFIFWIVGAYILCGLLAISASANADFCAGGTDMTPDSSILLALQNGGMDQTSINFEIARYYLNQCTMEAQTDPFLFLRKHQAEIANAQDIVQELTTSLDKIDVDTLGAECGRDFGPLTSSLDTMMAILDRLDEAAITGLDLLSCERIVPIYADVVYQGTCTHSVEGFTWMFSSLLIVATMGMLMITLRSSYLNSVINVELDENGDIDAVKKAMQRGTAVAEEANYDDHSEVNAHWQPEAARQDTSDSGSVYTDGNGELSVYPMDQNRSLEISPNSSPKLYELEENSYDSLGKVRPSAPYEHDLQLQDYSDYDYDPNENYKSRVY